MLVKRNKVFTIVLVCMLVLAGLIFPPLGLAVGKSKEDVPQYVLEEILTDRFVPYIDSAEIKTDFKKYLYQYESFDGDIDAERIIAPPVSKPHSLTLAEALEDVDILFRIFKFAYAGYEYFGGDAIFQKAKAAIEGELFEADWPVPTDTFTELLRDNLNFMKDGHSSFNRTNVYYHVNEVYPFHKDGEGYYTFIDKRKCYLAGIIGRDIEDYLKLSLNEEGEIVYCLSVLPQEVADISITMVLTAGDDRFTKNVYLNRGAPTIGFFEADSIYSFKEVEGIPLVTIKLFEPFTEEHVWQLYDFTEDAKKLNNHDIIILDLRGNGGGNPFYAQRWLENYCGTKVKAGHAASALYTRATLNSWQKFKEPDPQIAALVFDLLGDFPCYGFYPYNPEAYFPGWGPIEFSLPQTIKNSNTLFVLIDKDTASAAEHFISMLRRVDNVVIVGENSAGAYLTNGMYYFLPNSGMYIALGNFFFLEPGVGDIDCYGFRPDLLAPSGQALERVLKFIGRYDIGTLKYQIGH